MRHAAVAYVDMIVPLATVNIALVVLAFLAVAAAALVPPLILLLPLLALPSSVLMRLAVEAARDTTPPPGTIRTELGRMAGRKIALAAAQLLVLGLGTLNVSLSGAIGGVPGVATGLVAGYALIASSVYAVALWPIVCDPRRAGPLRGQLRLALALVLVRPLQLGFLALLTVLAGIVSAQLVIPALVLPSILALMIGAYVVDVADRLRVVGD